MRLLATFKIAFVVIVVIAGMASRLDAAPISNSVSASVSCGSPTGPDSGSFAAASNDLSTGAAVSIARNVVGCETFMIANAAAGPGAVGVEVWPGSNSHTLTWAIAFAEAVWSEDYYLPMGGVPVIPTIDIPYSFQGHNNGWAWLVVTSSNGLHYEATATLYYSDPLSLCSPSAGNYCAGVIHLRDSHFAGGAYQLVFSLFAESWETQEGWAQMWVGPESVSFQPVPEPGTIGLTTLGGAMLLLAARRRR